MLSTKTHQVLNVYIAKLFSTESLFKSLQVYLGGSFVMMTCAVFLKSTFEFLFFCGGCNIASTNINSNNMGGMFSAN